MAPATRSDRGGQNAGHAFRVILQKHHLLQSMSRADNPYDNAFMDGVARRSCFSRFKAEVLQDGVFESIDNAQTEMFEFIEMYRASVAIMLKEGIPRWK